MNATKGPFDALREEAERRGHFIASDGYGAVRVASWDDVLRLLKALDEVADVARAAISWTQGDVKITLCQRLEDALNER